LEAFLHQNPSLKTSRRRSVSSPPRAVSSPPSIVTVTESHLLFDGMPGRFTVKLNGKKEIEYNGSDGDAEYAERSYPSFCIGDGCGVDDSTDNGDADACIEVQLDLTLDEFPTEAGYSLICDGDTIWDVVKGTFNASRGFAKVNDDACVDAPSCCTFTVFDSYRDGLTSPQENMPGKFELKVE
jgi:hypothetical protein